MDEVDDLGGSKTPPGPYSYTAEIRAAEKRKHGGDEATSNKKQRGTAQTDPVFGQLSALPSCAGQNMSDDESKDCLQYLQSVRSEAIGMASFVTAPTSVDREPAYRPLQEAQGGDDGGYFDDGAFIARPDDVGLDDIDYDFDNEVHTIQSRALCERYERHRARLQTQPPPALKAAHDPTKHPIDIPRWTKRNPGLRLWRYQLQTNQPTQLQLALMDNSTVLGVLSFVENILMHWSVKQALPRPLGSWIWALLGRLEDVGQLKTDEVGTVRSLAKTAITLYARYRSRLRQDAADNVDGELATRPDTQNDDINDTNDVDEGHDDTTRFDTQNDDNHDTKRINDDVDQALNSKTPNENSLETLIAAKKADLEHAETSASDSIEKIALVEAPDTATIAALEAIIIIAGEYYGQRDLLDARQYFWEYDAPHA